MGLDAPGNFDLFTGTTLFRAKDVVRVDPAGPHVPVSDAEAGLVYEGEKVIVLKTGYERMPCKDKSHSFYTVAVSKCTYTCTFPPLSSFVQESPSSRLALL